MTTTVNRSGDEPLLAAIEQSVYGAITFGRPTPWVTEFSSLTPCIHYDERHACRSLIPTNPG